MVFYDISQLSKLVDWLIEWEEFMEVKDILPMLVDIHNRLAEINVHGDDTIRMAEVLQKCRSIVFQAQKELDETKEG